MKQFINNLTIQQFNNRSAFTLIELLLTTAIVAVLGTIGLIYILNYKQRQNLSSDTQEIVVIIRNAQDRSISQEATSTQGSGGCWGIHFENPSSGADFYALFKGLTYATSAIVSQNVLSSSVQFDTPTSSSSSTVIFLPFTGLPDNSLTVKISVIGNPTVSSTIIINSNGKIQY